MFIIVLSVLIIPLLFYPEQLLGQLKNEFIIKDYLLVFTGVILTASFLKNFFSTNTWRIKNSTKLYMLYISVALVSWLINGRIFNTGYLLSITLYGVLYCSVSYLSTAKINPIRMAQYWAWALFIHGVFGIIQITHNEQVVSAIGNRNFYGGFIIAGLPFVIVLIGHNLRKKSYPSVVMYACILSLSLFNLYYTRCRAGWLLIGCTVLVLVLFRMKRVVRYTVLAGLITLMFLPYARTVIRSNIQNDVRPYIWQGTLQLIADKPLIGVGAGNFYIEYPAYRPHEYFLLSKATDNTRHAHNELLEVWAETGSLGLCLLLAVLGFIAFNVFSAFRQNRLTTFSWAVVFSTCGIVLHNMVDVNMRFTTMAVVFWCNLGILSALFEPTTEMILPKWKRYLKIPAWAVFVICSGVIIWLFVVQSFRVETLFQKAYTARVKNNLQNAVTYYDKAIDVQPNNISLLYHAAFAFTHAGQPEKALGLYSRIIERAPYYASVKKNSAICNMMLKNYQKAVEQYLAFNQLNPYDPEVYLNMSYCYHELGDAAQSRMLRAQALEMYYRRADMLFNDGLYRSAREYLEAAIKIAPDNSSIVMLYARSCVAMEDRSAAVSLLTDFLKRFPSDKTVQAYLLQITSK